MTDRKPPGVSWQSWIERQIDEGRDQGAFEQLAGHGRPLAEFDRRDENWWVRDKLRREKVEVPPPPAIAVRRDVDAFFAGLAQIETEDEVRRSIEELNERIRATNRTVTHGPPTTLMAFDVADIVERWQTLRHGD